MPTPKQLISETLTGLGQSIISRQSELKQLQIRKMDLLDALINMDEAEEDLRYTIKGLKDKAEWEMGQHEKLIAAEAKRRGVTPQPTRADMPPPLPGDEWKGA